MTNTMTNLESIKKEFGENSFEYFKAEMDAIPKRDKGYKHSIESAGNWIKHEVKINEKTWKALEESVENLTFEVGYASWGYGLYYENVEKIENDMYRVTWTSYSSCD